MDVNGVASLWMLAMMFAHDWRLPFCSLSNACGIVVPLVWFRLVGLRVGQNQFVSATKLDSAIMFTSALRSPPSSMNRSAVGSAFFFAAAVVVESVRAAGLPALPGTGGAFGLTGA